MTIARRALTAALTAFALLLLGLVAAPPALAAGSIVIGTGSGLRGSVASADGGTGTVTVSVYRVSDAGNESWAGHEEFAGGGSYDFPSLTAGHYRVYFYRQGYIDQCYGGDPCTVVEVVAGRAAVLEQVTLVRPAPGTLTGKVVDGTGSPLPGATVVATNSESGTFTTTTGSAGTWTIPGLASEVGWELAYSKSGRVGVSGYEYPVAGLTHNVGTVVLAAPGTISGVVRDGANNPIAGADVYIAGADSYFPAHVSTLADGSYTLGAVEPGHYRVSVAADGHPFTYYPNVREESDAKLVALLESGTATANFKLPDAASIAGSFTDASGDPLTGSVELYNERDGSYSNSWADGSYSFTNLWPDTYTVRGSSDGYRNTWLGGVAKKADAHWLDLSSGGESSGNDLALPVLPVLVVTGTVKDTTGTPVAGVTVRLQGADAEGVTGPDGSLQLSVSGAGTYKVVVSAGSAQICGGDDAPACPTPTVVVPEAGATGVTITVPRVGSLSGALTFTGGFQPSWVELNVADAQGDNYAFLDLDQAADFNVRLPFGTYEVTVESDDGAPFRASVTIDGDEHLDVALSSGFDVSGTVSASLSDEVEVVAVDATTHERVAHDWVDVSTNGQGIYHLQHLNPGSYLVGAYTEGGEWFWYPSGSDPRKATPVDVVDTAVSGIDFAAVQSELVRVSGTVRLPVGIPLSAASNLHIYFDNQATGDHVHPVVNADATYAVDLPAGDYLVGVDSEESIGTASLSEELSVTSTLNHDLVLVEGATLTGRLVDADGLGVSGFLTALVDGAQVGWAETDRYGYWTLRGLPGGAIGVIASPDGFVTFTGSFVSVAGQTVDTGVQHLVAAGRIEVRIPEADSEYKVSVQVTDLAGKALATEGIWSGESERIDGLPAGEVLVRFSGSGIETEWWRDAATAAAATKVTVKAGETTSTIVPDLSPAPLLADGKISGTVTNASGRIGDLYIVAHYADQPEVVGAVGANGTYSVSLPPGSYLVQAILCSGYWMGPSGCMGESVSSWYPSGSESTAENVEVDAGDNVTGIDLQLGGMRSFTNPTKPTVSGTPAIGATLTAAPGTWKPTASKTAYQWLRNGNAIAGATAGTYVVQSGDVGTQLSVQVTVTRLSYTPGVATSATIAVPAALVLNPTPIPTISGTATLGATLTAVPGTWGPGVVTLAYQWLRDGVPIAGATQPTHVVAGADAGKALSVTVTGSSAGYASVTKTSAPTVKVPTGTLTGRTPTITGTPRVGQTLTANTAGWLPPETTFTYQWLRKGKVIGGATAKTYLVAAADMGKAISVKVTGQAVGYSGVVTTTSKATKKVSRGVLVGPVPAFVAPVAVVVGKQLTITTGAWQPSGTALAIQWYRGSKKIRGARGTSYLLTPADAGKRIKVIVTGKLAGYATVTRSVSTAKVTPGTLTAVTPQVTGTAKVGQVLTAVPGAWGPAPVKLAYQWFRNGVRIAKATKATRLLGAADLGKLISVRVTGSKPGYSTAVRISSATAAVG